MTGRIDTTIEFRRTLSRGPAAVYVLPHRGEAFLKLGFSRDPLARMQSLHPRYFDFFDIERSILIETPRVQDARAIETQLKRRLLAHRAPAPLDVRHEAGGESEWYRGAYEAIEETLDEYAVMGYVVLRDARAQFGERLRKQSALTFEWAVLQWRVINEGDAFMVARATRVLTDTLDAFRFFEIDVVDVVPFDVAAWYAALR
jgi:T5orf172 domain